MYYYIPYILLFILILIISFSAYIKIKYRFWSIQPVFHVYNLNYMLFPPGIINHDLPEKNKYTNFDKIKTHVMNNLSEMQKAEFVKFVRLNYLENGSNRFSPRIENIFPYFSSHNQKCLVSFYNNNNLMLHLKKGTTIESPIIAGLITSRPLQVIINNGNKDSNFNAYYVDYLCVDKIQRKRGIAPELIQTHHYNQSHMNKNIVVSLFKREDELTGIVPLCVYTTFGFPVFTWGKPTQLNGLFKIIEINSSNFTFLYNFIKINQGLFDIFISVETSNIVELIKTKNIFINAILFEKDIICAYFFRKTCTFVDDNMEVLSCFASINAYKDNDIFVQGFKISFWDIAEKNNFGFSAIENISHNNIIIENIRKKTNPTIQSPTAYFFYNFAYPSFESNKTIIIN